MPTPDPLAGLIEAVRLSPENLPLRKHLAEAYANLGRFAEAEGEYRAILAAHAQEPTALLGLARVPSTKPIKSGVCRVGEARA